MDPRSKGLQAQPVRPTHNRAGERPAAAPDPGHMDGSGAGTLAFFLLAGLIIAGIVIHDYLLIVQGP